MQYVMCVHVCVHNRHRFCSEIHRQAGDLNNSASWTNSEKNRLSLNSFVFRFKRFCLFNSLLSFISPFAEVCVCEEDVTGLIVSLVLVSSLDPCGVKKNGTYCAWTLMISTQAQVCLFGGVKRSNNESGKKKKDFECLVEFN